MRVLPGAALALMLLGASATAAVVLTYETPATVGTTVTDPPVVFQVGAGGSNTRYFSPSLATTPNATGVTGTLRGAAGADATVKDALRIVEVAGAAQDVTLTATQVTNPRVEVFTWTVYDGTTLVGTLDMRSASPSLPLTLPPGGTYKMTLRVDMADGAGKHNAPSSFDLRLVFG